MIFLPEYPELTGATRSVLERMARAAYPPLQTLPPAEARAAYDVASGVLEVPRAELSRVEDFHIPARDGHSLHARLYAPSTAVLPVLLFFHGGGFTIGSVASHDILCRELSRLSGCAVVSLDYRLAPEHRFPTAVNDAWDATRWLATSGPSMDLDTSRMALGGDSAGGTLAAVCSIMARNEGLPIALQLLLYPGCAPDQSAPSHQRFGQGLVLDKPLIDWFLSQYADIEHRSGWHFAPLLAPDVDGVAPAWFGMAECDPLVDDGLAYADKLRAAGVAVDLEIYRGVTHGFINMGRAIPEARQAHQHAARALAHALCIKY